MTSTLTIDRTSLSLSALVVVGTRALAVSGAGYWVPDDGNDPLGLPSFQPRRLYAPDSAWVSGKKLLGSVLDQGVLTTAIRVIAPDAATLATRKAALEAALWQFSYTSTVVVDGVTLGAWASDPAAIQWATPTPVDRVNFTARCVVQIPVNP